MELIGLLVVVEVVLEALLQQMLVVEVELLRFQVQNKVQIYLLLKHLHMSGLVQGQVLKTQVQQQDLLK